MKKTDELIKRLKIRKQQLEKQFFNKNLKYDLHSMHHLRDVVTTLAVLESDTNAEKLLENMPTKKDL